MNAPLSIPESLHYYLLPDLTIIRISGPDATKYLQGQLTCDVNTLTIGNWCPGAHCSPKGKVLALFRLIKISDDTYFMLYKQGIETQQITALKKYAVFSKVDITEVTDQYQCCGIAGLSGAETAIHHDNDESIQLVLSPTRALYLTKDAVVPATIKAGKAPDWWGFEILDGIAHLPSSLYETHIPQAFNLQAIANGISFNKGCYTGQETVARAKYRGNNNRALYILQGTTDIHLNHLTQLEFQINENWKPAGDIVDFWQQGPNILLCAVFNNSLTNETVIRCQEDPASELRILPLPYTLS